MYIEKITIVGGYGRSGEKEPLVLRGNPPLGVCTICVGIKEVGWEKHFGVVRTLESDLFYKGQ